MRKFPLKDEQGKRYPTPEELIKAAEQRTRRLTEKLRELGVDPESIG